MDLLAIGERVTFRHPLVRSAVYRSAAVAERRAVHLALAEATDREADPDRRAWHLAAAAAGPDEQVARELERSAGRAQARGGLAAAAAFLQRAVALTQDPARRADRALAAAQASLQAGAFDTALGLAATAEAGALDEFQRARVDLLRAHVAFGAGQWQRCAAAAAEGREAARVVRPGPRARDLPDRLGRGGVRRTGSRGRDVLDDLPRRAGPPSARRVAPRPVDLLLDGFALLITDGTRRRGADACARAAFASRRHSTWRTSCGGAGWPQAPEPPCGTTTACSRSAARQVQLVRDAGALGHCRSHLTCLAMRRLWTATSPPPPRSWRRSTASRRRPGAASRPTPRCASGGLQGREAEASAAIAQRDRAGRRAGNDGCPGALGGRGPVQRPRPL